MWSGGNVGVGVVGVGLRGAIIIDGAIEESGVAGCRCWPQWNLVFWWCFGGSNVSEMGLLASWDLIRHGSTLIRH